MKKLIIKNFKCQIKNTQNILTRSAVQLAIINIPICNSMRKSAYAAAGDHHSRSHLLQ